LNPVSGIPLTNETISPFPSLHCCYKMNTTTMQLNRPARSHFILLFGCRIEASEMGRVAAQIQSLNQAI